MKNFLELSFNDINNLKISPKDCVKWATEFYKTKTNVFCLKKIV